jgi:hypothetical protein
MSFKSIPNQPILFHTESELGVNCNCNDDQYAQLVDYDDQLFFQLKSEYCDEALLSFETFEFGWGVPNEEGNICSVVDTSLGIHLISFRTLYPYQTYQITFNVLSLSSGVLNISCDGSNTFVIYTAGTYTLNFQNPTITLNSIVFRIESFDGFVGCIDSNVVVHGIPTSNQLKVGLVDSVTLEQVDVINPTYINTDDNVTIAINVPNLQVGDGCYRLAIADFCTNTCSQFYIQNNTFSVGQFGVPYWNVFNDAGAITYFNQNQFCLTTNIEGAAASLVNNNQFNQFCEGKFYYISIIVQNNVNTIISANIGNSSVEFPYGQTGYLTIGITAGSPNPLYGMNLFFFFENVNGLGEVCISQVDVQIDDSNIQWNYYSDIISIGDYDDDCKYLKVEGCNAEDQFGFSFADSSFLPSIRLEGIRTKAQYESNANLFRYSSGKWYTNYADITKQWTYHFGRLPEYVLDFLSTIFYYDNCYVNGFLVSPADDKFPQIKYDDADPKLGMFEIDLLAKNNKVVKSVCFSSDAQCLPSILDNPDEPFLLAEDGERLITEDGVNLYQEN